MDAKKGIECCEEEVVLFVQSTIHKSHDICCYMVDTTTTTTGITIIFVGVGDVALCCGQCVCWGVKKTTPLLLKFVQHLW